MLFRSSHHAQSANVEIGVPGVCEFTPLFYQCLSVSICGSMGRCFASKTLVKTFLSVILSCNFPDFFEEVPCGRGTACRAHFS